MNSKYIVACILLVLQSSCSVAAETNWPRLVNGKRHSECNAAFKMASSFHRSTAFTVWQWEPRAESAEHKLIFPNKVDGHGVDVKSTPFTQVEIPTKRIAYWQTAPYRNSRLVIEAELYGYRGDEYNVRVAHASLTPSSYFLTTHHYEDGPTTALFDATWMPPIVFQRKNTGYLWLIDVGSPRALTPYWKVYVPKEGKYLVTCQVQFSPKVTDSASLLPHPVQRLARLLDQSIGAFGEEDELRNEIQQTWVNVALRPGAMGSPFNSRKEVNSGLSRWAEKGKGYRVAHTQIKAQYRVAETALAMYYATQFNLSKNRSRSTAKKVLDIAFRRHYVFHTEKYD
ncbi:MAG: hypothetical protein WKG03_03580 [Telluria sp.]